MINLGMKFLKSPTSEKTEPTEIKLTIIATTSSDSNSDGLIIISFPVEYLHFGGRKEEGGREQKVRRDKVFLSLIIRI